MENLKQTKTIKPVSAPCQIAYMDRLTGLMDLRPYVDLNKRTSIWGIAINGLVFKKTHEENRTWLPTSQFSSEYKSRATLPTTNDLDTGYQYRQAFNETVEILKSCNIDADAWEEGLYWSSEDEGDKAAVVDMTSGQTDYIPKHQTNGRIRLVSQRIKEKQYISVGFALLYQNEGKFDWSLNLEPERLSQLWGINIGGVYLRVTEEPEKCTWYQGMEKARALSNEFCRVSLPRQEKFSFIGKFADDLNDSLAMISAYGISVDFVSTDFLEHRYLTSSEYGKDGFLSYDRRVTKKSTPCYCRFVGEEIE